MAMGLSSGEDERIQGVGKGVRISLTSHCIKHIEFTINSSYLLSRLQSRILHLIICLLDKHISSGRMKGYHSKKFEKQRKNLDTLKICA